MQLDFARVLQEAGGIARDNSDSGVHRILDYLSKHRVTNKVHVAYILATIAHETGWWMQPIREGALRYGPNYTDAQAVRAVTAIFNKGIIRTNYALPAGPYNKSYYGRGLIQITWLDNYEKFERLLKKPLVRNPDLALEWDTALDICVIGMQEGLFRKGHSLSSLTVASVPSFRAARGVVNGDVAKNGTHIANIAMAFYNNLK